MISRRFIAVITLVFCTTLTPAFAEKGGKLVRIMRNRDGSVTEFKRNPENTVLEKRTYIEKKSGEKIIRSRTIYRRDKFGNLRSGAIYDGKKRHLFRVVYGYQKSSGLLIAENMFDARVKRTDPQDPSKEIPVRATRYTYDVQGRRSKPQIFTSQKGKYVEELLDWLDQNRHASSIDGDPFRSAPVKP